MSSLHRYVCHAYLHGKRLKEIASRLGCSQERVREVLATYYRDDLVADVDQDWEVVKERGLQCHES